MLLWPSKCNKWRSNSYCESFWPEAQKPCQQCLVKKTRTFSHKNLHSKSYNWKTEQWGRTLFPFQLVGVSEKKKNIECKNNSSSLIWSYRVSQKDRRNHNFLFGPGKHRDLTHYIFDNNFLNLQINKHPWVIQRSIDCTELTEILQWHQSWAILPKMLPNALVWQGGSHKIRGSGEMA